MTSFDQPLPQSPDAERAVLGSILINNNAFYRVVDKLAPEDFFRDNHRLIFSRMRALAEQSREIDLLTIKEALGAELSSAGGSAYISSLIDGIPDVANVERYAGIVKEKSMLRRLIVMGNSVMKAAVDSPGDAGEVLNMAEREIFSIAEGAVERAFTPIAAIARSNMKAIETIQTSGRPITGLPTGYVRFDEFTSGFQPKDLIILAARPSMGKTAFMLNIASFLGLPKETTTDLYSVGIFSLEMSKEQLGMRLLSSESGVSGHLIRSGLLSERNWSDLVKASARIAKGRIAIDDTPAIDVMELRAKARRLRAEFGLDILMVDYLQLMNVKGRHESRQQEISSISRGLKAVAKELDVPLISLSQLSRRPEQRTGDHRPQLSDLRDSGAIEQDADVVVFLYRDEVYDKESEDKGIAEIIISKQRNGPIGDFKLVFRNDLTKFFNYEPGPSDEFTPGGERVYRLTNEQQRSL